MKKVYETPKFMEEVFMANEYVAACGMDENHNYIFKCDAGNSNNHYSVWVENGKEAGLQTSGPNADTVLAGKGGKYSSYHPCGETHIMNNEKDLENDLVSGYIQKQTTGFYGNITTSGPVTSVTIWTANNTNVHCTTNVDKNTWLTPQVRS